MTTKELIRAVKDANPDIGQRVKSVAFRMLYDAKSDIFYFALTDFEPGNPVISVEDPDPESGVMLRVEDQTWRLVGFDILWWKEIHLNKDAAARKAFGPVFKLVGDAGFKLEYAPAEDDPVRLYVPGQVHNVLDAA